MGNYNCKDCLGKNASSINEMLINTELFTKESDQDITRNTRSDRLKILKSANKDNEIINVEKKQEKNINTLRKEERDNNILLKNELNKIKDIDIEVQNSNNSNEVNKLIEKQRKKILEQKKIIDEYKTKESLYEKQKEEMEQTQKMIRQQQSLLDKQEKEIENKRTHIISRKQLKISSPKIKNFPTEMSDKKRIIKKEKEREIKKFERTQVIKPHFINNKEIIKQNIKKETLDSENQIEENDNYEKIEVYEDEEDQSRNFHQQSQKFKIETYEPIEPGSKNDNDINSNYNELNNIILEPRDSSKLNSRKDTSPKIKKKEGSPRGPRDSGKNGININFRGTFENQENKKERKKSEKVEQIFYSNLEPRDSKRKDNIEFNFNSTNVNKNTNSDINDYLIQENNNNENINEVLIQSEEQNINIFGDNNNNIDDNNSIDNNNIYFSKEYNINLQQESPKFNYGYKLPII